MCEDFDTMIKMWIEDPDSFCVGERESWILSKDVKIVYYQHHIDIDGVGVHLQYPREQVKSLNVEIK